MTEGGWDRPHDRAKTLGERDGNDIGDEDDDNGYGEVGDIPDDDERQRYCRHCRHGQFLRDRHGTDSTVSA